MDWAMAGATVIFLLVLVLTVSGLLSKAAGSLLGAGIFLAAGWVSPEFGYSFVPWDYLFFLIGTLVIAGMLAGSGAPEAAGAWLANLCRGRGRPFLAVLALVAALTALVFGSPAAVLFWLPAARWTALRLEVKNGPYQLAVLFAAVTGGLASLTGNPANLILGREADYGQLDFLFTFGPLAAVLLILGISGLILGFLAPTKVRFDIRHNLKATPLGAPVQAGQVKRAGIAAGLLFAGFVLLDLTHLPAAAVALTALAVLLVLTGIRDFGSLAPHLELEHLLTALATFVMAAGLLELGVFRFAVEGLTPVIQPASPWFWAAVAGLCAGLGLLAGVMVPIALVLGLGSELGNLLDYDQLHLFWYLTAGAISLGALGTRASSLTAWLGLKDGYEGVNRPLVLALLQGGLIAAGGTGLVFWLLKNS